MNRPRRKSTKMDPNAGRQKRSPPFTQDRNPSTLRNELDFFFIPPFIVLHCSSFLDARYISFFLSFFLLFGRGYYYVDIEQDGREFPFSSETMVASSVFDHNDGC